MALAYFAVPGTGLPAELVDIPLKDFAGALAWLRNQPAVDPAHVALGASRGGELALLLAATYSQQLQAVAAYVPSSVVNGGKAKWGSASAGSAA